MRRSGHRVAAAWALAVLIVVPALAAEGPRVAVTTGFFNLFADRSASTQEASLEYRRPLGRLGLRLGVGAAGTANGSFWGHGSVQRPFVLSPRWQLAPGLGLALYEAGDGKELGGAVEFRSSLELDYALRHRLRIGLAIYHMSNAGLYDLNPGSNSLVVLFSLPVD